MTTIISDRSVGFELANNAMALGDAEVPGMIFVRIVNGKMIEGWGLHDRLGAVQQFDKAKSREA